MGVPAKYNDAIVTWIQQTPLVTTPFCLIRPLTAIGPHRTCICCGVIVAWMESTEIHLVPNCVGTDLLKPYYHPSNFGSSYFYSYVFHTRTSELPCPLVIHFNCTVHCGFIYLVIHALKTIYKKSTPSFIATTFCQLDAILQGFML